MALYRVWRDEVTECFWLLASSEADAIHSVGLALQLDEAELKATLSSDGHFVSEGLILIGSGEAFPTPKADE